ncbi:MAG: DUF5666 domain-containing protein [Acidobacteriaceae bacterium]
MKLGSINLAILLAGALAVASAQAALAAQNSSTAAAPSRVVGSVTAINGQSITVKPDQGAPVTFTVGENAKILETQPGAKTLAGATAIQLTGIAVGDRVLAALHPAADGGAPMATTVIAMKQAALAQRQEAEEAAWQKNGVGGLVKSVDAATGTVTIASGAHTITIHTTPSTVIRRYSSDSIKFADARASSLADIHAGDQLRAKGQHSADGSEVTADAIVAGSFRNIAGTVLKVDAAANTVTVKDLATKKLVVIHVTAESRMHKLPEQMAQGIAMRMKRKPGEHAGKGGSAQAEEHAGMRQSGAGAQQQHGGGDLSQMLQRTPVVQISDLHKGDAVMIVATQGTPDSATAVTLLAGVEPILTASPSASKNMFSASWSLGGGGGGGGDQGGGGDSGGTQ